MKKAGILKGPILAVIAGLILAGCATALALDTPEPNSNQVSYWCGTDGVKIEPVATPFFVPAPPAGKVWTLLVLKAGDENSTDIVNQTFDDPAVGGFYSRTDGKKISHIILCFDDVPPPPPGDDPTTTSSSSTTTSSTTTTSTTTTSTIPVCVGCVPGTVSVTPPTTQATETSTSAPVAATTFPPTTDPGTTVPGLPETS